MSSSLCPPLDHVSCDLSITFLTLVLRAYTAACLLSQIRLISSQERGCPFHAPAQWLPRLQETSTLLLTWHRTPWGGGSYLFDRRRQILKMLAGGRGRYRVQFGTAVLAEAREGWWEVDPVGELYGQRRGEVDGMAAGLVVGEVVQRLFGQVGEDLERGHGHLLTKEAGRHG